MLSKSIDFAFSDKKDMEEFEHAGFLHKRNVGLTLPIRASL